MSRTIPLSPVGLWQCIRGYPYGPSHKLIEPTVQDLRTHDIADSKPFARLLTAVKQEGQITDQKAAQEVKKLLASRAQTVLSKQRKAYLFTQIDSQYKLGIFPSVKMIIAIAGGFFVALLLFYYSAKICFLIKSAGILGSENACKKIISDLTRRFKKAAIYQVLDTPINRLVRSLLTTSLTLLWFNQRQKTAIQEEINQELSANKQTRVVALVISASIASALCCHLLFYLSQKMPR